MMKRDLKIKVLILLMSLTMVSLILVQAFWFSRAHDTRETQFAERANLALRNVADDLFRMQGDNQSQIPAVKRTAANSFFVATERNFRIETLDSLLKSTFIRHGLESDFEYSMLESNGGKLVLGNYVQFDSINSNAPSCRSRVQDSTMYNFMVTFPNMGDHVLQSMDIWIYSSVAMVVVLVIFTLFLVILMREKRLAKLKKNFINNLTHELKTPITNISIASEVLLSPGSGRADKQLLYADIIHKETQRLKTLVDRVLQISVLESGKINLNKEKVDLNELVKEVIHVATPRIEQRNGEITHALDATNATLLADRHHLLNTLYNLIDNADKYSPERPKIHISTKNDKGGIHIAIHDNGKGVSPEKQKLIFDKFYRAEEGDVQNERGFGLGLSYVQLILKAHKGRIGIRSLPGSGSCFTIFLPFDTSL